MPLLPIFMRCGLVIDNNQCKNPAIVVFGSAGIYGRNSDGVMMRFVKLFPLILFLVCWVGAAQAMAKSNLVECSSINFAKRQCPADTTGGVELAEQLSRASCDEGRTWGYEEQGVWVKGGCRGRFRILPAHRGPTTERRARHKPHRSQRRANVTLPADQISEVYCASRRNRYQHCDAETRGRSMHLVHEFSDEACEYGRTWGYNSRGIWVDRGCVGLFRMKRRFVPPPRMVRVICESEDYQRVRCPVDRMGHVEFRRQLSRTDCERGVNWGQYRRGIWVKDGCRALFDVVELGTGLPGWMYGRFEGRDPRRKERVVLTIRTNGNVKARRNQRRIHAELDGDLLVLGGTPYEIAKTRRGFRAENTLSGAFKTIRFRRIEE